MFGQLVFSSIPMRDVVPLVSRNLTRSSWIASSMDARDMGDEDVMLMINGLTDSSGELDRIAST
jgi:hypothetical protein